MQLQFLCKNNNNKNVLSFYLWIEKFCHIDHMEIEYFHELLWYVYRVSLYLKIALDSWDIGEIQNDCIQCVGSIVSDQKTFLDIPNIESYFQL